MHAIVAIRSHYCKRAQKYMHATVPLWCHYYMRTQKYQHATVALRCHYCKGAQKHIHATVAISNPLLMSITKTKFSSVVTSVFRVQRDFVTS